MLVQVRQAVAEAGSAILDVYADPASFETELKQDDSPLTAADKAAKAAAATAKEKTNQFATYSQPITVVVNPEPEKK